MKNFNKKIIVAIMLLVILFANNLGVYAYTDEEILNSISESFTLINQENGVLIDVSVDVDTATVKNKYGDDVEFYLDSDEPYVNVNGNKYYIQSQFDMALVPSKNNSSRLEVWRTGSEVNREESTTIGFSTTNDSKLEWTDVTNKTVVSETGSKVKNLGGNTFDENEHKISFSEVESGVSIWFENDDERNRDFFEQLSDYQNFDSTFEKDGTKRKYELSIDKDGIYQINAFAANERTKMSGLKLYEVVADGSLVEISEAEYMTAFTGNANMSDLTVLLKADKKYVLVSEQNIDFSHIDMVYKSDKSTEEEYKEYIYKINPTLENVDKAASGTLPNFFEKVFAFFVRLIGEIINKLIGLIAGEPLSVDKLVFDDYSRAQLTFFEKDLRFYDNAYNPLIKDSIKPLNRIFSLFRNLALVAYMMILVYLGIRVLLFSTGDKQAKYKQVLVDWVKGIAIIFLFPYVIRYAINLNHALVSYLQTSSQSFLANDNVATIPVQGGTIADSNNNTEISSEASGYMYEMYQQAKDGWLAPAICWFVMLIQIVQFLIVYYKRLITVMFLIAIFPLVSISYALDKIADGKSQAFNNWCKEFFLQVFIQSFHAINYVLVMSIICSLQPENWLLKIIGITYVSKGADVIKNMFAQIRGTKGGGPLELAKSMLKTKVAINSVKSLKNFASSAFGANSRLGRGLQRIDLARTEAAQGKLATSLLNRNEALRASGNMFNPNGTVARPLTDDEAKQYMRDVLDENKRKTDPNHKEKVDALARMDSSDLERLANEEGYTDHKKRNLEYLLKIAAANQMAHGAKNGRPDVNIVSSVDILIKAKGQNSIASRYMAESNIPSDNVLRGMAAANSIVVDEDSAIAHRQARASAPPDLDDKDRVRNTMLRLKDAHNGCGLMELYEDIETIKAARASGDAELNAIIDDEEKDMSYTVEDLELNLYAQVVNHSNDAEFYNNPEGRKLTDKSITKLKEAQNNLRSETDATKRAVQGRILAGVNAKIEDLNVGETPVLINREVQRNKALQKRLDSRLEELRDNVKNATGVELDANEFLDKGPEHDAYLANKAQEYKRMAGHDWIAGGIETAAGAAISGKMLAYGTALSGVMVGASTEGKNDVFSDVIKNAPAGYSIVGSVAKGVDDIASVPFSAADSAIDRRLVGDRVSLKTNRKSMEINEKYYTDQARSNAVNSEISQAEATRRALLKRLHDTNNTNNTSS